MKHLKYTPALALACAFFGYSTSAPAAFITFVSVDGSDAGACTITAPCKTFAYAHDQTNANGTINVLTSGSYGPVTITKSISIVAEGVHALINSGADGAAIIIQAAAQSWFHFVG
jgi:hypothetical protein